MVKILIGHEGADEFDTFLRGDGLPKRHNEVLQCKTCRWFNYSHKAEKWASSVEQWACRLNPEHSYHTEDDYCSHWEKWR